MNESMQEELRQGVERIVGPVIAGARRKRLMREELMGHLQETFEEEMQDIGDERRAMEAASGRLGSRTELAEELQKCVPWAERLFVLIVGRKENQMSKFWMVWIGMVLVAFAAVFPQFVGGVLAGFVVGGLTGLTGAGWVRYSKNSGSVARVMMLLLGVFGVLFGMALILPGLARYKRQGYFELQNGAAVAAGILIVIAGFMLIGRRIVGVRSRLA